jgi:hypothetical protein
MSNPAIILGNVSSILRLPPPKMRNPHEWGQFDSDNVAHLLQVQGQIQHSQWNKSDIRFTNQGDRLLDASFPEFADFVFAAVYFRQLIMKKDDLLNVAADCYRKFVDCPIRNVWIHEEQKRFGAQLDGAAFMLSAYTVRELFDAFMYGASLTHRPPHINSDHRARFLQIVDKEPRQKVLYALNISMKTMMNHVGNIAAVLYRDFGHWLHDHSLPLPDVRWHDRLFTVKKDA